MRGVAFIVAVAVVAEVGDFRRLDNPRQLMAYLELASPEHSSGTSIRRAEITPTSDYPPPTLRIYTSSRPAPPGYLPLNKA